MSTINFEEVKEIIKEKLNIQDKEIKAESSFADLGADSLDVVELIMALEEKYSIEIPDDQAEKIKTVQDAITYIQEHKA